MYFYGNVVFVLPGDEIGILLLWKWGREIGWPILKGKLGLGYEVAKKMPFFGLTGIYENELMLTLIWKMNESNGNNFQMGNSIRFPLQKANRAEKWKSKI